MRGLHPHQYLTKNHKSCLIRTKSSFDSAKKQLYRKEGGTTKGATLLLYTIISVCFKF